MLCSNSTNEGIPNAVLLSVLLNCYHYLEFRNVILLLEAGLTSPVNGKGNPLKGYAILRRVEGLRIIPQPFEGFHL